MCLGALQRLPPTGPRMSKLSFSFAKERLDDPLSCFKLVTDTRNLKLSPKYIGDVGSGIREQLDANLNLFSHSLGGVMIAYSNIRRLRSHGTIVGSQPCIHVGIQADFIVFQPESGSTLKGVVNKVFRSHVGCLIHSTFNASIPKQCRDGQSLLETDLQTGQEILFKVVKVSAQNGVLSMIGCFFDESFDLLPSSQQNTNVAPVHDEIDSATAAGNISELHSPKQNRSHKDASSDILLNDSTAEFTRLGSISYEAMETSQSEDLGLEKKKKKKKKKHRGDHKEEVAPGASVEPSDNFSNGSLADSGIVDNTPVQSDSERKKNRKRKHTDEAQVECMETSTSESAHYGESAGDSAKKKKKKKNKERRETLDRSVSVDETSNVLEMSVEQENSESIDRTLNATFGDEHSMTASQSSAKKKKKKKHKHSD